jgi:hypothetical protein
MVRKILTVFAVALVIAGSTAQAGTIKSITATTVGTTFSSFTGILAINGITGIDVQDMADIVTTSGGGSFRLDTHLLSDTSLPGGIASGTFTGGTFEYKDASSVVMLSGDIGSFSLVEVFNGLGIFTGEGYFTVTSGTLQTGFGTATGSMVDISFSVDPKTISNFSTGFTASSTMTVLPSPEPATIALLTIGALGFLKRKSSK